MKKFLLVCFLVVGFSLNAQQLNYLENEVLIQLVPNASATALSQEISAFEIENATLISRPMNIWRIKLVPSNSLTEDQAITELYRNPSVMVAQKNHRVNSRASLLPFWMMVWI